MTEELAKLSQRFQQADASTTRKFGGTGLGLCLARACADMLGGSVTVETTPGHGTSLTVTLPATYVSAKADTEAINTGEEPAGYLVLVIDDDADPRTSMTRFLRREGFKSPTA